MVGGRATTLCSSVAGDCAVVVYVAQLCTTKIMVGSGLNNM